MEGGSQMKRRRVVQRLRGARRDVLRSIGEEAVVTDRAGASFDAGLIDIGATIVTLIADRSPLPETSYWVTFVVGNLKFTTSVEVERAFKRSGNSDEYVWSCSRGPALDMWRDAPPRQ